MILIGCQKEDRTIDPTFRQSVTVAAAQEWFEDNLSPKAGRLRNNLPGRTPLWESAEMTTLTNGRPAIAVPLRDTQPGPGNGLLTRLLLYEEQNGWQAKVMKVAGDSAYFHGNRGSVNMGNFSGLLTLHDWQDNFLSGFTFQDGRITGNLSMSGTSARIGCQLITVTFYTKVCMGGSCTTSIDYEVDYVVCGGEEGGGGGGGNPLPKGPVGGGGGMPTPGQPLTFASLKPKANFTIPGQEKNPIDVARYLDCFGIDAGDASYQITVYVDEPVAGSGDTKFGLNVGHAFVGLKKTLADGSFTEQVFGFYPTQYSTGWVGSKFSDNGGSPYTVSVSFPVTAQQFSDASNATRYMTGEMYSVVNHNCTDAVFYIFDAMGVSLPKNRSPFLFGVGSGHSPGRLGLDFRGKASQYPVNLIPGNAPGSKGPC